MFELYITDPFGAHVRRITNNQKYNDGFGAYAGGEGDFNPTWSPDGHWIAFTRNVGPHRGIWLARPDGTHQHPINDSAFAEAPSWSPDGCRIAFVWNRGLRYDLFTMDIDGSHVRRLTSGIVAMYCAWSPDGQEIVFQGARDTNSKYEIYRISAVGGVPHRLTSTYISQTPRWA
jgi:TolB protein